MTIFLQDHCPTAKIILSLVVLFKHCMRNVCFTESPDFLCPSPNQILSWSKANLSMEGTVSHFLLPWQNTRGNNLKEEKFIMAHSFRCFRAKSTPLLWTSDEADHQQDHNGGVWKKDSGVGCEIMLQRHTSRCPLPWTRQALPGSFYHFPVKSLYYDSMNRLIHWADQGHWDIYHIRSSDSSCTSLHKKHSHYTPVLYGTKTNTNMFKPDQSLLYPCSHECQGISELPQVRVFGILGLREVWCHS